MHAVSEFEVRSTSAVDSPQAVHVAMTDTSTSCDEAPARSIICPMSTARSRIIRASSSLLADACTGAEYGVPRSTATIGIGWVVGDGSSTIFSTARRAIRWAARAALVAFPDPDCFDRPSSPLTRARCDPCASAPEVPDRARCEPTLRVAAVPASEGGR